jgi:NAD(P)-dependent dehydrogenase (short-subunit alcohol dehydrogenase family)
VLITGATRGIGEVAALELARLGAHVVAVARNPARGEATVRRIREATGREVDLLLADLAAQAEVRRLAAEVHARYERLDVLVNNAGAVFTSRQVSPDGVELTWALNHLAPFLLTQLLIDIMKASAPARIVTVSSDAHRAGRIAWEDPEHRRGYNGWIAYSQSKLANVLFTVELARRLEGTGVTANVLHPGFVATGFGKNNGGLWRWLMGLAHLAAITPEEGAKTTVYLASAPEVEGVTGWYFERCAPLLPATAARSTADAARLWELSERMVGLTTAAGG